MREEEVWVAARMLLPAAWFWTLCLALATPRAGLQRRHGREFGGC